MKYRTMISIVMLLIVVLSACKPVAQPPSSDATSYPASGEAYPVVEEGAAYPAAANDSQASVLYPGPKSGEEVSWQAAISMMKNGEVTQIVQTKDLQLTLSLRDGRSLVTWEAAFDEVKTFIQECGAACKDIKLVNQ